MFVAVMGIWTKAVPRGAGIAYSLSHLEGEFFKKAFLAWRGRLTPDSHCPAIPIVVLNEKTQALTTLPFGTKA